MQFTYIGNQSKKDVRLAGSFANSAFVTANSAASFANGAFVTANSAAAFANGAFLRANASYTAQNTTASFANGAFVTANSAASFANGAFAAANLKFNSSGGTISGDVNITGNLSVTGNTFSTSATQIVANDTLFIMGTGNYSGDVLDIGFAAHYNNGINAHTGLIRDSATKEWQLFEEYTPEVGANNNIDINHASFKIATLNANLHSTLITIKNIDLLPYVNNAYDSANSGATFANVAFNAANSAAEFANSSFVRANSSYAAQNTTATFANLAFAHANAAFNAANTGSSGGGTQSSLTHDTFTANGSSSTFNLSTAPTDETYTLVNIDGVLQLKSSYTLSGNTITLSETPENGVLIDVTTLGMGLISSQDPFARAQANAAFDAANNTTGSSIAWYIANANTTMVASSGYFVDTSNGPKTMTLPTTATLGDTIRINDLAGTFSANNLTIDRNSHKIQGNTNDLLVNVDQSSFGLIYSNSTYGWKVMEL